LKNHDRPGAHIAPLYPAINRPSGAVSSLGPLSTSKGAARIRILPPMPPLPKRAISP
jgi:hypothetical protein